MSITILGASGHLAQTKLIPKLLDAGYKKAYFVSRKPNSESNWLTYDDPLPITHVTYCAINSSHMPPLIPHISKKTTLCLEKPVGTWFADSLNVMKHLPYNTVFVDHFLCKFIPDLKKYLIDPTEITSIYLNFYETDGVNHRIDTFKELGIVRDFVQNHGLMVVAEMLSKTCECSRASILNCIQPFERRNSEKDIYPGYQGTIAAPTSIQCHTTVQLSESNNPIKLCFDVCKMYHKNEYSITIKTKYHEKHKFRFSPWPVYEKYANDILVDCEMIPEYDAYTRVLSLALHNETDIFPSSHEVLRSWVIVDKLL